MRSSYKPFAIGEFKTGVNNYLEPYLRPNDAFDPLSNAFVFRGSLSKRNGYSILGKMAYRDSGVVIATGNGTISYAGTLSTIPIRAGSFTATNGVEAFSDNGLGVLTGNAGGTGTINYTTGAWTLVFNTAVIMGVLIRASYTYISVGRPIMGIKTYVDEDNDSETLVVCDTRRASIYNSISNVFEPLSLVSQLLWIGDATTTTFITVLGWQNIAPYSVEITDGTSTINDDGVGGFNTSGNFAAGSTIDYSTGAIGVVFTAAPATGVEITITLSLAGDYFSGTNTNFFNSVNWKATTSATAYLYLTNNVDRITLFDGTNLSRPPFSTTLAGNTSFTNDIETCLDINVYTNRLLLVRPVIVGNAFPDGQSIRWSALFNPFNFAADFAGNGGELSAPTSDWIQSDKFLRGTLVVNFTESTWTFRYTGSDFNPFRFDRLNSSKSCRAPYASVEYDERVTFAGNKGLMACDGVNVQRYDISIVDQFLEINQDYFSSCFAQKFDTLNQTWMLYPSQSSEINNRALVYNFLENTWAIYDLPMSCLGLYKASTDAVWDDFAPGGRYYDSTTGSTWETSDFPWDAYANQSLSPILLGGDQNGVIYTMDSGVTDNTNVITSEIVSTRWNPFVGTGQRVTFGYIDFYYEVNADCVMTINFWVNNSSTVAATRTLTMDGPPGNDFTWKRIYVNLTGEFLRMQMLTESESTFKISGLILWAQPSGRLTGGLSV
jgi:hypothetical protein